MKGSIISAYIGFLLIYSLGLTLLAPAFAEDFDISIPIYPVECGTIGTDGEEVTDNCLDYPPTDTGNWLQDIFNGLFGLVITTWAFGTFILAELWFLVTIISKVPAFTGVTLIMITPILYTVLIAVIKLFLSKSDS